MKIRERERVFFLFPVKGSSNRRRLASREGEGVLSSLSYSLPLAEMQGADIMGELDPGEMLREDLGGSWAVLFFRH